MTEPRESWSATESAGEGVASPAAPPPRTLRGDIVFAFALALACYVAWVVREVLMLIYVSALFAVVLMPVVRAITSARIGRWRPGRGTAILLLFIAAAVFVGLFAAFALPPLVRDLEEFTRELPKRGPLLLERMHHLPLIENLDLSEVSGKLQDLASNLATYIFFSIRNWAATLFEVITGIVLTVYFMLEGETAYRWLLSFFPSRTRMRLDRTLQRAEARMGKWLLGQGALMLILGVASTAVFLALRVRYAYALGVVMGLFNLVPVAGAFLSMALVVLVAAVDSWGRVAGVLIFYAIYAQVETSYLTPRIMKSSVDLAGLAVMVALLLGASLGGILGAMVSVPTAVLVAVLVDEYLVHREPAAEIEIAGSPPSR